MKRSTLLSIVTLVILFSTTNTASACCLPCLLNPFAWFGCYGCGYGGYGAGYGGYGAGYGGYGAGYGGYGAGYGGGYAPQMPIMNGSPGCNCTSAIPQQHQQALTSVQVPVTRYQAVTQYVPQTTYQTQYRQAAPAGYQNAPVAYAPPYGGGPGYPATSYYNPAPAQTATIYNQAAAPVNSVPTFYGNPTNYQATPNVATPYPAGDIAGDHEYPTQGMLAPINPNTGYGAVPIRRVSYGVTPRSALRYSSVVR